MIIKRFPDDPSIVLSKPPVEECSDEQKESESIAAELRVARDLADAIEAMKLGMAARDFTEKTGLPFADPFEGYEHDSLCFWAGYENDLAAWLDIRSALLGVGFGE